MFYIFYLKKSSSRPLFFFFLADLGIMTVLWQRCHGSCLSSTFTCLVFLFSLLVQFTICWAADTFLYSVAQIFLGAHTYNSDLDHEICQQALHGEDYIDKWKMRIHDIQIY